MQISSVGTSLCILANTSCMYIMYALNFPLCVNELILSFLPFIQLLANNWLCNDSEVVDIHI